VAISKAISKVMNHHTGKLTA